MGKRLNYEISERYRQELNELVYKLDQLENGRIYELTGAKMDGYLATNIQKIRDIINDLLNKIQNDAPSIEEQLRECMNKLSI